MKLILLTLTMAFFVGTAHSATINGWRSDVQEVFESGRNNCALAARAYQAPGQPALVILTQVTSERAKSECEQEGKVFGVYFNCSAEQTSEQKSFGHSGVCARQVNATVTEQIYKDGLTNNLRVIIRDSNSGKNKYMNFYNSRRVL